MPGPSWPVIVTPSVGAPFQDCGICSVASLVRYAAIPALRTAPVAHDATCQKGAKKQSGTATGNQNVNRSRFSSAPTWPQVGDVAGRCGQPT